MVDTLVLAGLFTVVFLGGFILGRSWDRLVGR